EAFGIDIDPLSPVNATNNAKLNEVTLKTQHAKISDLKECVNAQYILANISTPSHLESVKDYYFHLKAEGMLVLSGILDTDLPEIKSAFEPNGFEFIEATKEAGWLVITFIKKSLN